MVSNIEKMDEQEFAELQIESQAVVGELLKAIQTPDKCIDAFIRWVLPQWPTFWGRFQADGTMSWKDFEQFVQWEERWQGDVRRVFSLFDPSSTGLITKPSVLEARRKWQNSKDLSFNSIENFKWQFAQRWGSLGRGWRLVLDTENSGHCPQLLFMRACHSTGMNRNLKALWRRLTKGDISRSLVLRDLDPELDKVLTTFAYKLVTLHTTLREGWCAVCRAGGGHLHESAFEAACEGFGIDNKGAKMLFAALDPTKRRYLTEYDKLDFLEIWNPGNQLGAASAAAAAASLLEGAAPGGNASKGSPDDVPMMPNLGNFEFELVLSREEYAEYLKRRRGARIRAGLQGQKQDIGAKAQRKQLFTKKPRPPSAPPRLGSRSGSTGNLPQTKSNQDNVWHTLAPNALGSGSQSLVRTGQSLSSSRGASLGRLLSCPATTG